MTCIKQIWKKGAIQLTSNQGSLLQDYTEGQVTTHSGYRLFQVWDVACASWRARPAAQIYLRYYWGQVIFPPWVCLPCSLLPRENLFRSFCPLQRRVLGWVTTEVVVLPKAQPSHHYCDLGTILWTPGLFNGSNASRVFFFPSPLFFFLNFQL